MGPRRWTIGRGRAAWRDGDTKRDKDGIEIPRIRERSTNLLRYAVRYVSTMMMVKDLDVKL